MFQYALVKLLSLTINHHPRITNDTHALMHKHTHTGTCADYPIIDSGFYHHLVCIADICNISTSFLFSVTMATVKEHSVIVRWIGLEIIFTFTSPSLPQITRGLSVAHRFQTRIGVCNRFKENEKTISVRSQLGA